MVREYQEQNVYEALMDRFKLLFEEFSFFLKNLTISMYLFPEVKTAACC